MKIFYLHNKAYSSSFDFRDYRNIIEKDVKKVLPNASVICMKRFFLVNPAPNKKQSIMIGENLCKRVEFQQYIVHIPRLLDGVKISDDKFFEISNSISKSGNSRVTKK